VKVKELEWTMQQKHLVESIALEFAEEKQDLIELPDKNPVYVHLSSDDPDFAVSEAEKQVTRDFYRLQK
jgi:hypothetical protein